MTVISAFSDDSAALRTAAKDMAALVQNADSDSPGLAVAVEFWQAMLDADRQIVPVDILPALGRWAFVLGIDDTRWLDLMSQTLQLSGGLIDYRIEVADRCVSEEPTSKHLTVLHQLLGSGEPWERHYVEGAALDVLRAAARQPVGPEFVRLRTRLIELGQHDTADVYPDDQANN